MWPSSAQARAIRSELVVEVVAYLHTVLTDSKISDAGPIRPW